MRLFLLTLHVLLISFSGVHGTHIKAGEIKAERTSTTALTYRFTLSLYTNDAAGIDQSLATMNFGDGSSAQVSRQTLLFLGNGTSQNLFVFFHTYKAVGFYKVGFREENRNAGILNMSNSVNTAFYVELGFLIDPFLGLNSSPVLSVPPIDEGAVGKIYTHNPGAYDPDGDSLSFKFVTPKSSAGSNVLDYRLPGNPFFGGTSTGGGPAFLTLDAVTGDIVWNAPSAYGLTPRYYNIAIMIEEWRLGVRIGYVIRDMQIEIKQSVNNPPVLQLPRDTCVVAGTFLQQTISASDLDGNSLYLQAFSGTFSLSVSPATFNVVGNITPSPFGSFEWQTTCAHVREQPYSVVYRVQDTFSVAPHLSDVRSRLIYVKAPKPQNLQSTPSTSSIQLTWDPYFCPQAATMRIYRKECGAENFNPGPCEDGIPANSGYELVAEVPMSTTTYTDDNKGLGLSKGVIYCYTIIASFPLPGNGVSFPADETCAQLKLDVPLMASVSVLSTSLTTGQIALRWFTPLESLLPLPYEYEIWRSSSDAPTAYTLVNTLTAPPVPVDTFFTDTGLNTLEKQYFYKVRLVGGTDTEYSPEQSSILLKLRSNNASVRLSWNVIAASQLDTVEVYRSVNGAPYTLIATLKDKKEIDTYTDNTVQNCDTVCYYILMKASYCDPRLTGVMYSLSPTVCTIPLDDRAPKAPTLIINSCSTQPNLENNVLLWNSVADPQCNTIKGYKIYFAPHTGEELSYLNFTGATTFLHNNNDGSLAGCYEVAAVNYRDVEGARSNRVCIDNCVYYKLPNLITRNNDGLNDVFKAFPVPEGVKSVDLKVYNRWGGQVFGYEGEPTIEWDCTDASGKAVSEGVYYFEANVTYFRRLNPDDEHQIIKGWIHILGSKE